MEQKFQFFTEPEIGALDEDSNSGFEESEGSERILKVRLDKWLWAARFFKTRAIAREAVEKGKVFYNGERSKPSREIEVGAILQIRQGRFEKTVIIKGLSTRRRSTDEALQLFEETEESKLTREQQELDWPTQEFHHDNSYIPQDNRDRRSVRFLRRSFARPERSQPPNHFQEQPPYHEPPRFNAPRYTEPRYPEPRYSEPRHHDNRFNAPQYGGSGYQDHHEPRYPEPRYNDNRYPDPRYQEPRFHQQRYQEPRYNNEPRYNEPRHNESRHKDPRYGGRNYSDPRINDYRQNPSQPRYPQTRYPESHYDAERNQSHYPSQPMNYNNNVYQNQRPNNPRYGARKPHIRKDGPDQKPFTQRPPKEFENFE